MTMPPARPPARRAALMTLTSGLSGLRGALTARRDAYGGAWMRWCGHDGGGAAAGGMSAETEKEKAARMTQSL